MKVYFER